MHWKEEARDQRQGDLQGQGLAQGQGPNHDLVHEHHQPQKVKIQGATGPYESLVNGVFERTDEMCGGRSVYLKPGQSKEWLEYDEKWYVSPTRNGGRVHGYMRFTSDFPTWLEVTSGVCEVWDDNQDRWTRQTSVIVLATPSGQR